jgi:hypothetical protein
MAIWFMKTATSEEPVAKQTKLTIFTANVFKNLGSCNLSDQ